MYKDGDIKGNYYLYFPTLAFVSWFCYYFSEKAEKFKKGNANPGIVISENPTKIAVSVDLGIKGDFYPAFKIIQTKSLKYVHIGDKIATVAYYFGCIDDEHWNDVDPELIKQFSINSQIEKRILNTFSDENWDFIEENKHQIPENFKNNGLYKIKGNFSACD